MSTTDAYDLIKQGLGKSIKSADRRTELAENIHDALTQAGHLWEDGWVETVEVHHARVVTERVEIHGLIIELDALGNAVTVNSPHGFMVVE
jgi:hypothetical protein